MTYPYDPEADACIGCPGCLTGGRCIDDPDACPYGDPEDEDWGGDYVHGRPVQDVPTGGLL